MAVAYDPATGDHRSLYGLGRANHENSVAIPGFGQAVLLTGDDTFAAPSSQVYMYTAADADAVWDDQGHLFAFQSDVATVNDYGDLAGLQRRRPFHRRAGRIARQSHVRGRPPIPLRRRRRRPDRPW